jgi:hypothetical protein
MSLNLFPARVAIGRFMGADGKNVDVLCTPEFFRAMSDLFARVGGANGTGLDDMALLSLLSGDPVDGQLADIQVDDGIEFQHGAQLATMQSSIDEIQLRAAAHDGGGRDEPIARALADIQFLAAAVSNLTAEVQELRKAAASAELSTGYQDQFRVNWERPGKIGSLTANTGAFTTLTASAAVALSPANANVVISPTGTGVVLMQPATIGNIDNVRIGITTPQAGRFTSGGFSATVFIDGKSLRIGTPVAAAGVGGDVRFHDDTGTLRWLAGILGTAAATDYSIFDFISGLVRLKVDAAGLVTCNNGLTVAAGVLTTLGGATMHTTSTALTNGAGVAAGTLLNAPAAGDPTKWIGVNDNGTIRYVPSW